MRFKRKTVKTKFKKKKIKTLKELHYRTRIIERLQCRFRVNNYRQKSIAIENFPTLLSKTLRDNVYLFHQRIFVRTVQRRRERDSRLWPEMKKTLNFEHLERTVQTPQRTTDDVLYPNKPLAIRHYQMLIDIYNSDATKLIVRISFRLTCRKRFSSLTRGRPNQTTAF